MCDKTSSLRVPYITFYGNWWLLAKNRDTREKKLAFLEAILSYAFDGVEVDFDGNGDGKKHGVDYAALDGFLAAQPVVDTQIRAFENGRKTWNKRRAVAEPIAEDAAEPKKRGRKAKKAHDDTPPEPADETISDEVPHTKEQRAADSRMPAAYLRRLGRALRIMPRAAPGTPNIMQGKKPDM